MVALLLSLALLGGLAWALTRGTTGGDTSGAGGAQRVEVPEVVGLTLQEARGRLGDAGLELGSQKEAVSGEVTAGAVIDQSPQPGTEAERGTAVDVVVSAGPEPTTHSPSASPSASAPSSPTSSASASPAGGEGSRARAGDAQREAAREAQQEARKAAKERQEKLREARKERKEEG